MTNAEIAAFTKFCLDKAGKVATATKRQKDKSSGEVKHTGRLIAYGVDADNRAFVILEDDTLKKRDLPEPLPNIPYKKDAIYCLVSPCHLGRVCEPNSLVFQDTANESQATLFVPTLPDPPVQPVSRACNHKECSDPRFCYLKYTGFI